ncbi:MAG: DUF2889 domain-containing protein [Firmicutes bacterium]|nr:DUF2889 domain-containing protein [Bacillota bacterium]
MTNVFQRHWFTTVRRTGGDGLLDARTVYRGTDGEFAALLKVKPAVLQIVSAVWEEYAPRPKAVDIEGLTGVEAYFNCGPILREVLSGLGSFTRSLFAETVRGVIQAETFLLKERGYNSPAEYDRYWNGFYAGSCRYYSNLDRVSKTWNEHAGSYRTTNLFNRFKTQSLYSVPRGGYRISGTLSDSFHELGADILVDREFWIKEANGVLLRCPDDVCREAAEHLHNLPGNRAAFTDKKGLAELLGAGAGCVHLIDLVNDAFKSIELYIGKGDGNI